MFRALHSHTPHPNLGNQRPSQQPKRSPDGFPGPAPGVNVCIHRPWEKILRCHRQRARARSARKETFIHEIDNALLGLHLQVFLYMVLMVEVQGKICLNGFSQKPNLAARPETWIKSRN